MMKRAVLFFAVIFVSAGVPALIGQREGPPRKIENPQTMKLPGGSRVEFDSFFAPALGRQADYSVFFPPSYDDLKAGQALPVVYFLHGMWNDHTSWVVQRYGSVPQRLERLMMADRIPETLVVSPDGENSFYTDFLDGSENFERLVYEDLLSIVESRYRVRPERSSRGIAGVSMGGYGSLKIAMKFPELFASVVAISPIVFTGEDPSAPIMNSSSRGARYFQSALKPVYGMPFEPDHWRENSLEVLASTADVKDLRIYFSYGTADRYDRSFPMRRGVETLSRVLRKRSIPHQFDLIQNGPHGWDLVQGQLEEIFAFVTQTFGKVNVAQSLRETRLSQSKRKTEE
jgi:enterochelin esterase family protein